MTPAFRIGRPPRGKRRSRVVRTEAPAKFSESSVTFWGEVVSVRATASRLPASPAPIILLSVSHHGPLPRIRRRPRAPAIDVAGRLWHLCGALHRRGLRRVDVRDGGAGPR